MNPYQFNFVINIADAKKELDRLYDELKSDTFTLSENNAQMRLSHIFWHLSLAWNGRNYCINDISAMSPEEMDKLGNTIPNFDCPFQWPKSN